MIEAIVREMLLLVIAKIQLFVFDLITKAQILICKLFFFFGNHGCPNQSIRLSTNLSMF
jgi:hypothetical protein